jgi:hypothetical protein
MATASPVSRSCPALVTQAVPQRTDGTKIRALHGLFVSSRTPS